jgi:hypothetical protein
MTQPPLAPAPGAGFPAEPVPSIWPPVILGTAIFALLTFFPNCANLSCLCCGIGLWPGIVLAVMWQVRRDRAMRVQDGGVVGFMIGGLAGLLRAASSLATGGVEISPEEKERFFKDYEQYSKAPLDPEQRRMVEETIDTVVPYLPWLTAVVFAVSGIVVGILVAAMVTSSRRRQWTPPPPPPAGVLPAG